MGKYEKIKMKCIILLLIDLLVKKRNDKIIGGLVLRGESKCDKATGNVTEVQTGSCHSSYTQADILSFLLNCVCLISLGGGEHENNDKDDSVSGVQYFVPGTVLNTL